MLKNKTISTKTMNWTSQLLTIFVMLCLQLMGKTMFFAVCVVHVVVYILSRLFCSFQDSNWQYVVETPKPEETIVLQTWKKQLDVVLDVLGPGFILKQLTNVLLEPVQPTCHPRKCSRNYLGRSLVENYQALLATRMNLQLSILTCIFLKE